METLQLTFPPEMQSKTRFKGKTHDEVNMRGKNQQRYRWIQLNWTENGDKLRIGSPEGDTEKLTARSGSKGQPG